MQIFGVSHPPKLVSQSKWGSTSQLARQRINVTTEHDGICCTSVLLSDTHIKVEERKIRWSDEEVEEARVQTVTFGSPCNSPDEIHHHHQQINKE